MFRVILCIQFYRLTQLIFSTSLKGIIRKECQSFTNHGHDKTPPTVFNPLSLWLTLPRNMGVSHTLWPLSITRATLACLWFAQGSKKIKAAEMFLSACGLHRVCTGTKNENSRATLACQWFAQGISPNQNSFQGHYPQRIQSFTNHGHDKTPPTVFNPLSLWLTLPRNMGVSHTLWPPSIARAILACQWFAQGLHKAQKNQNSRAVL